MAFVTGFSTGAASVRGAQVSSVSLFENSSLSASRRGGARKGTRAVVKAQLGQEEQGKDVPQLGWFPFNETLNGRLAMVGFVLGLTTEIVAPGHPSIISQLLAAVPMHVKLAMASIIS
mmetsp:Transcript_8687/g.18516  ORF Transcript_8687/g.18516 Transcript_8687/m.18516 type:complete len:118 (+) Transcript_8687:83-436(+)|eukprot:CAMPEP_0185846698 /NCGR_PEP_ID=MMETSP1354-20130828/2248_1 /TAXON_ID=708628 /ORGANISM="Erythrolobus madagascarensis, Strain CCMP3276" /LENGTH=117 /DNA_ID=CAMNT_0028546887 /DNA_START=50 /DNA_END=403 /DNA_ORIENTATION=-